MSQKRYPSVSFVVMGLLCLQSISLGQAVRSINDLVRASSSSDRKVWLPAVKELGRLAAKNHNLQNSIWDRAKVNTLGMKFVRINHGEFAMGPDMHRLFNPQIKHKVKITKSFYISVTEVTNEQFSALFPQYERSARYSPEPDSPAVRISWKQAVEFCSVLSKREGVIYRLPTEAEWEYACRAGTTSLYSFGSSANRMGEYGWCLSEISHASPVAMLKPNAWGLYDMLGNAFEWVLDFYSDDYYRFCEAQGVIEDPQGPRSGLSHVIRGGGWQVTNPLACTCTARFPLPLLKRKPFAAGPEIQETIGFRVVRVAEKDQ